MSISLAVKYRPKTWDDVIEQDAIKTILKNQLATGGIKNAYLFAGPAGCGKTTCARIFADEINNHCGNIIEMDAASNSGVSDVRNIIQMAQTKSIDSRYKIFIIDECHSISNTGWQAFLKLLEEPPATSIFIFCTTDPQKIPKTILSRVQRYDFWRISQNGIIKRLEYILSEEYGQDAAYYLNNDNTLGYIAKLANGHLRSGITMLDQCLAYNPTLTIENVQKVLGLESISTMMRLFDNIAYKQFVDVIEIIEEVYSSGHDLKQFVKSFLQFLLDCGKSVSGCPEEYIDTPIDKDWIKSINEEANADYYKTVLFQTIERTLQLVNTIRWESNPKILIETAFLEMCQ